MDTSFYGTLHMYCVPLLFMTNSKAKMQQNGVSNAFPLDAPFYTPLTRFTLVFASNIQIFGSKGHI